MLVHAYVKEWVLVHARVVDYLLCGITIHRGTPLLVVVVILVSTDIVVGTA